MQLSKQTIGRAVLLTFALVAVAMLAGTGWESWAEARDAGRFPAPGKLVDVGGRRLHILCKGAQRGPTVVMVAGGGTPAVVSYQLQDRIARFAHVCSYDRAGLGWSDASARALTFDEQAGDLARVLNSAHEAGPFVFVPESFGGLIVMAFAARHPDQVSGIVFLDAAEPDLWFEAMKDQSGVDADLRGMVMQAAWRTGAVRLLFPVLAPDWVDALPQPRRGELRAVYSRPAPGYAEALDAYRVTPAGRRPRLDARSLGTRPVIVIRHGRPSAMLSPAFERGWQAAQVRLAGISRKGIVVTAANADHAVAQEAPDLAAAQVRKLLSEIPGSAR